VLDDGSVLSASVDVAPLHDVGSSAVSTEQDSTTSNGTAEFSPDEGSGNAALAPRFDIYSDFAGELFWTRLENPSGQPVVYTIIRNGVVQTETSGTSFFDSSFVRIVGAQYEIITNVLDDGSVLSASVDIGPNLQVVPSAISGELDPSFVDEPMQDMFTPSGARGLVYSSSALELFWGRPEPGTVSSYNIFLDGVLLGNIEGLSFFVGRLNPDTVYEFTIESIDTNGLTVGIPPVFQLTTLSDDV